MRVDCKCISTPGCPMNVTSIEGTGIIPQPEGCDLFIGQLTLPASRRFESKANWEGPEIVLPQTPDLLLPEEVTYLEQHQPLLEDVWNAEGSPGDGATLPAAPMTMTQLHHQMEARRMMRKWRCGGIVAGSMAAAAVICLCLWRYRQAVLTYMATCTRRRTTTDHTQGNSRALQGDDPRRATRREMVTEGSQPTGDSRSVPETVVFQ